MKIVIADGLPASAIEALRQPDWQIDTKQGRSAAELAADLKDADALVVRSATKVTREVIDAAPKLRIIARAGTGVDNVRRARNCGRTDRAPKEVVHVTGRSLLRSSRRGGHRSGRVRRQGAAGHEVEGRGEARRPP